jgi:hypothetical protein
MKFICPLVLFSFSILLRAQELDPDARKAWTSSGKSIAEVLELEELREELPRSSWFSRDQKDLDRKISRITGELVEILRVSGLSQARERMQELQDLEARRLTELRSLREKIVVAPEEVSVLEFYRKDREKLKEEAEVLEEEIGRLSRLQEELIEEMTEVAARSGLSIDAEQMRFLLSSVSGEDLLDLGAVFQNVRELNTMLEGLVRENPDDTEAARRYYGMHVILLRTLVQAHDDVVVQVDERYLPRVKELKAENEDLQKETDRLLRFSEKSQQELLRSSRNTQRVTAEALELYEEHLMSVRDRVYEARKEIQQRIDVAWNAYRTIRIAATLAEEMAHAVSDLQTLRSLEVPELLPLQDKALQKKFMELSEQLKE